MPLHIKTRLFALLTALLLLAGCAEIPAVIPEAADDTPEAGDVPDAPAPEAEDNTGYAKSDSVFSINFNPDASLNPLVGVNTYNEEMFSLLYEGLFRLGDGFVPENVLCSYYTTEDGKTFYFHIKEGVKFHDGSTLTAHDVEYTINRAAAGSKYKARLSGVRAVNAESDDVLSIVLTSPNYQLPALLDIPVIKSGDGGDPPVGTGPYAFLKVGARSMLAAFRDHRDYSSLPLNIIYLRDTDYGDVARAFSGKALDILTFDPTGTKTYNIHMNYETRYCDTTDLIYLGFNTSRGAGSSAPVRRAIASLVDRDTICAEIFGDSVTPAPLILSPALSGYDKAWEEGTGYSYTSFIDLAAEAGIEDSDGDGMWDHSSEVANLDLTFIVNNENEFKLQAARGIAAELRANGFNIELRELSYDRFLENLAAGTYNICLAEVRFMPDFDLSAFLGRGGRLNYTNTSDGHYTELINAFLATEGDDHVGAMRELCEYTLEKSLIVPICYKKTAVITHIGEVSGMTPSYTGVFSDIAEWTVTLD